MISFKDFLVVDDPSDTRDDLIKYREQKRHRGVIGEGTDDPCWDGYTQRGMKKKNGKEVPNCVPEEKEVQEALNTQQRMKRKQLMRRLKAKIQLGRKRSMKKKASQEKLKKRADKRARMAIFKKLSGGKSKDEMNYAQRAAMEKRLASKSGAIARLARKLLPTVRKDDMNKMVHKGDTK